MPGSGWSPIVAGMEPSRGAPLARGRALTVDVLLVVGVTAIQLLGCWASERIGMGRSPHWRPLDPLAGAEAFFVPGPHGAAFHVPQHRRALSEQTLGVLQQQPLISLDDDDRVLVMRQGQIVGEIERQDLSEENILAYSIGGRNGH